MKIFGRTAVVTGASRGIGRAVAQAIARAGGRVVLLARSSDVENVAAEIVAAGGAARAYRGDLTDADAVEDIGRRVMGDLGEPSIIVNNAGAGRWLYVEETSSTEAVEMMASPYFAAFFVTRVFLPAMLARRDGCIVNVNSPAAFMPWPGAAGYAASRFALRGLTAALRVDLQGTGVRVLEVVPGLVASTYFEHNRDAAPRIPQITRLMPRLSPDDVAVALVSGIETDRRRIVMPAMLRLTMMINALSPSLIAWLMARTGWRRADNAEKE